MSCLTCAFYLMPDGVCRRFPPAVIPVKGKEDRWRSAFPPMAPGGWCGEFKQVEEKKR